MPYVTSGLTACARWHSTWSDAPSSLAGTHGRRQIDACCLCHQFALGNTMVIQLPDQEPGVWSSLPLRSTREHLFGTFQCQAAAHLQVLHLTVQALGSCLAGPCSCPLSFQAGSGLLQLLLCPLQGLLLVIQLTLQCLCCGCLLCCPPFCLLATCSQACCLTTQLHGFSCPFLQNPKPLSGLCSDPMHPPDLRLELEVKCCGLS